MRVPIRSAIKYFSESECACKGTGVIQMDPLFTEAIVTLRETWGEPLAVSSICRTPDHNRAEKGHRNSLHLTENPKWPTVGSLAADIKWRSWNNEKKLKFARLAWSMGWSVGLHNSFCHIDRRGDLMVSGLPQNIFIYGTWGNYFSEQEVKDVE